MADRDIFGLRRPAPNFNISFRFCNMYLSYSVFCDVYFSYSVICISLVITIRVTGSYFKDTRVSIERKLTQYADDMQLIVLLLCEKMN